jgi:hypothetical protein
MTYVDARYKLLNMNLGEHMEGAYRRCEGRPGMTYEEIERRYPLLIDSMKWAAILSTTEAADCIRALQEHRGSGEAVDHFGGPRAVLAGALRCRRRHQEHHVPSKGGNLAFLARHEQTGALSVRGVEEESVGARDDELSALREGGATGSSHAVGVQLL